MKRNIIEKVGSFEPTSDCRQSPALLCGIFRKRLISGWIPSADFLIMIGRKRKRFAPFWMVRRKCFTLSKGANHYAKKNC